MKQYKEIFNQLPTTWNELKLKDYIRISNVEIKENEDDILNGIENTLSVISMLTGESIEAIEALPMKYIIELGTKMKFMVTPPVITGKAPIKLKQLNTLTFDDYITFIQLQKEPIKNLDKIVQVFSVDKLSDEAVGNMSVTDAMECFFLLQTQSKKLIKRTILKTRLKIIQLLIQTNLLRFKEKIMNWLRL